MRDYPVTTGLQAAAAGFRGSLETWRSQMSRREFDELFELIRTTIDRETPSDAAHASSVVAEGAADAIFGRPRSANPYTSEAQAARDSWALGWAYGQGFLETRATEETRRWLDAA